MVTEIRIIVFGGLFWGPLILVNYHFSFWRLEDKVARSPYFQRFIDLPGVQDRMMIGWIFGKGAGKPEFSNFANTQKR